MLYSPHPLPRGVHHYWRTQGWIWWRNIDSWRSKSECDHETVVRMVASEVNTPSSSMCERTLFNVVWRDPCQCCVKGPLSIMCERTLFSVVWRDPCHCCVKGPLSLLCEGTLVIVVWRDPCQCCVKGPLSILCEGTLVNLVWRDPCQSCVKGPLSILCEGTLVNYVWKDPVQCCVKGPLSMLLKWIPFSIVYICTVHRLCYLGVHFKLKQMYKMMSLHYSMILLGVRTYIDFAF